MMDLRLDSIIIFVEDMARMEDFYVGILGLDIVEKIEGEWLLLGAGTTKIGLHKIGQAYIIDSQTDYRLRRNTKLVFQLEHDIFALRKELIAQNVKLKEIMDWENYDHWVCDGEDPEGNVFQLKARK
ncbi:MAG: VOC family protein [Bacteroidota bacterium]